MITNKEEENVCFICYELKVRQERKPKRLKNQKLYIKTCDCDGYVHNECLKTWYIKSSKCPICRELMLNKIAPVVVLVTMNAPINENINENVNQNQIINHGIRMRIYCYIQKNLFQVASMSYLLLFFYLVISFYNSVFNKVNADLI